MQGDIRHGRYRLGRPQLYFIGSRMLHNLRGAEGFESVQKIIGTLDESRYCF